MQTIIYDYKLWQIERILAGNVDLPTMPEFQKVFLEKERQGAQDRLTAIRKKHRVSLKQFQERLKH